jgi:hypothetical protein
MPAVHSGMKAANIIAWFFRIVLWIPIIFFSMLLTHNAMLYFTHGGEYGILPEKFVARHDVVWNLAFYIHLPAGIICLLAPVFLFARKIFKSARDFHVAVGKLYVWVTLVLVSPTGMYLALYAKGGLITQAGFMLQGVLLGWFTWEGYRAIARQNKLAHVQHMIRSYAVATVVLSFRILHILFFIWKVPYLENYAISQWLGLTGNLLLAEIIIMFTTDKLKNTQNLKIVNL